LYNNHLSGPVTYFIQSGQAVLWFKYPDEQFLAGYMVQRSSTINSYLKLHPCTKLLRHKISQPAKYSCYSPVYTDYLGFNDPLSSNFSNLCKWALRDLEWESR